VVLTPELHLSALGLNLNFLKQGGRQASQYESLSKLVCMQKSKQNPSGKEPLVRYSRSHLQAEVSEALDGIV